MRKFKKSFFNHNISDEMKKSIDKVLLLTEKKLDNKACIEKLSDIYLPTGKIVVWRSNPSNSSFILNEKLPCGRFPVFQFDGVDKGAFMKFKNDCRPIKWRKPNLALLNASYLDLTGKLDLLIDDDLMECDENYRRNVNEYFGRLDEDAEDYEDGDYEDTYDDVDYENEVINKTFEVFAPGVIILEDIERYCIDLLRGMLMSDSAIICDDYIPVENKDDEPPFESLELTHPDAKIVFSGTNGSYLTLLGYNKQDEVVCLVFYLVQK